MMTLRLLQYGICCSPKHENRRTHILCAPQAEAEALAAALAEDLLRCKGVLAERDGASEGACWTPLLDAV